MRIREFWHQDSSESRILEKETVREAESQLVVKALYSLVSSGTERIIATGGVPQEIREAMSVPYMEGDFGFPVKYGYSLVGKVISEGTALTGKLVHVMHPHQDYVLIKAADAFIIPDGIPPTRAVFASNMETALNGIWEGGIGPGDRVLICGFGVIGALTSLIAAGIPAVKVTVIEPDNLRRQLAHTLGFETPAGNPGRQDFDVAVNASGAPEGLQICIDSATAEGTILEMSWYGNREITLHLGGSFHTGRKRIISSQVSEVARAKRSRYDHHRRKQVVFRLLENKLLDRLPFDPVPFDHMPELFGRIRNGTYRGFCSLIKYS